MTVLILCRNILKQEQNEVKAAQQVSKQCRVQSEHMLVVKAEDPDSLSCTSIIAQGANLHVGTSKSPSNGHCFANYWKIHC